MFTGTMSVPLDRPGRSQLPVHSGEGRILPMEAFGLDCQMRLRGQWFLTGIEL